MNSVGLPSKYLACRVKIVIEMNVRDKFPRLDKICFWNLFLMTSSLSKGHKFIFLFFTFYEGKSQSIVLLPNILPNKFHIKKTYLLYLLLSVTIIKFVWTANCIILLDAVLYNMLIFRIHVSYKYVSERKRCESAGVAENTTGNKRNRKNCRISVGNWKAVQMLVFIHTIC